MLQNLLKFKEKSSKEVRC